MRHISSKSRTLSLIFCIVGFFGVAGIHRFYVGKVWTGLLYLVTGGIFGIGTILDLIKISTGTFTDALRDPVIKD